MELNKFMKKTLLKLLLVCLIASCCLFVYKTLEFMYKTSAILNKYEREITILQIGLDWQKTRLEDTDKLLEKQLNHFHEDSLDDPDKLLKAAISPSMLESMFGIKVDD